MVLIGVFYRVECNVPNAGTHSYTAHAPDHEACEPVNCPNKPNTLETYLINRMNANTIIHSYTHARTHIENKIVLAEK